MTKKIICLFGILAFCTCMIFSEGRISDYTLNNLNELMNMMMEFSGRDDSPEKILKEIDNFEKKVYSELEAHALDYEQEKLIFESDFAVQRYTYIFSVSDNLRNVRLELKEQTEKNERFLASHDSSQVNAWMYSLTGDVTSLYMTFSFWLTIRNGFHIKDLYEKALAANPNLPCACSGLGQWFLYAPGIFGGSMSKAGIRFKHGYDTASNEGEKFFACLYYSQFLFETGKKSEAKTYLAEAEEIFPAGKNIKLYRRLNEKGISMFDYNREHTGVDKNKNENATL